MSDTPKDCPFCNEPAYLNSRRGDFVGFYVACLTEDCCGNPSDDGFSFITADMAVEAWNTRLAEKAKPPEVEPGYYHGFIEVMQEWGGRNIYDEEMTENFIVHLNNAGYKVFKA